VRGIVLSFGRALGCTAATLFLLAAPASAGAAPAAALGAQWGGFYAGGEVGGAWSKFDWTYTNPNFYNTLGALLLGSDFSHSASSMIGGVFTGYNFQTGPWVYGVEISVAASDLKRTKPSPFFPADTYTSKLDWLSTATARAGYAFGNWLVYAKGGYAGADVKLTLFAPTGSVRAEDSFWANGWTVGGGLDYRLNNSVTLGVVYSYVDLSVDGESVNCPLCGTGVGFGTPIVNGDIRVQSVMARLSYLFGH
jgi:outer membrane immunogenic protein